MGQRYVSPASTLSYWMVKVTEFQVVTKLPDDVTLLIGQVVVAWSVQMWLLAHLTYRVLGLGPKEGRLAVREPRPDEFVAMIRQLMEIKGFTTAVDTDDLAIDLRELKRIRDSLAHGVYGHDEVTGRVNLQSTGGTWRPHPKEGKVSKKIIPQAILATSDGLVTVLQGIASTIRSTDQLIVEVDQQIALRKKSP